MGQVPIDAVSKLREIFRVLIGDSAEEWESQKQQSEFGIKTDLEWTAHLLSIHRRYCTANDGCNLPHYQSNDLSSHTLSWENKPPSPVPVSAPIPSQHRLGPNLSSAATKANITGFYQRPHLPRRVPYSFNRHAQRRRGGTSKTSRYRSNFTAKPSSSAVTPHTVNTEAATSSRIVESEETEEDVIIIKEEPGYEYEEASTEDMYEGVAEYGRAGDYNERVSGESYSVGVMPGFSESEAECAPDPEDFGDGDGVSVKLEGMESKVEEMDGEEQQTRNLTSDRAENSKFSSCTETSTFARYGAASSKRPWTSTRPRDYEARQNTRQSDQVIVRKNKMVNERYGSRRNHTETSGGTSKPNWMLSSSELSFDEVTPEPHGSQSLDGLLPTVASDVVVDTGLADGLLQGYVGSGCVWFPQRSTSHETSSFDCKICAICYEAFKTNAAMKAHMPIHAQKKFRCSVCAKMFRSKQQLTKHSRLHTGEMPYICRFCYRRFRDCSNMRKHEIKIHDY